MFISFNNLHISKMPKQLSLKSLKVILHLLLLAITLRCAVAARILTEDDDTPSPVVDVAPAAAPSTTSGTEAHPPLTFFMHDILGGATPSGRVVAGIVANTQIEGLPFSKPNSGVFPLSGGIPLVTANNGININNQGNNLPFLGGLNGARASTVISNNGNNNFVTSGNTLPFVTAGQLPRGSTLEKLMFGTITVIDDELTEGHELGASVIGKAQGFHLASSLDGSSQTMAFSAMFDDHEEDTINFFGVHRTAAPESQIAIVGGTGKYENAQGYATLETLQLSNQHITDGVETILQFTVYLTQ